MIRKYPDTTKKEENLKGILVQKTFTIHLLKILLVTMCIVAASLLVALVIVANLPKSQGYVIELTPDGAVSYNTDAITLLDNWSPKDNTINYFLRSFITQLRSVSSDPQVVQSNIDKLYRQVTGEAADAVTAYLKETSPKDRLKNETVTIKIASILPLSESTYQVDFRETIWTASSHSLKSDTHYRCVVHTAIYTPRTEEQRAYNPIGLYVTSFDIVLVKEI